VKSPAPITPSERGRGNRSEISQSSKLLPGSGCAPTLRMVKFLVAASTVRMKAGDPPSFCSTATYCPAGTAGVGSGAHFSGVYLEQITGVKLQYVPYRGTGPALQDLMAGQIDIIVDQASNSLPQVQAGRIRAYGITDTKRLSAAPDIPTVDEAGLPGFHIELWSAVWAPKGTPKDIIAKLNAAVVEALADPAVQKRFADSGLEVPPRAKQTPEALAAHQQAEVKKWWPMIKAANIKVH